MTEPAGRVPVQAAVDDDGIAGVAPAPRWAATADRILAPLLLVAALSVTVWLAIPTILRGLSAGDDGYFAEFAKAFVQGRGYGLPISHDVISLFDPGSGSGPALELPLAAVIKVAGTSDFLPGSVTLVGFLLLLGVTAVALGRRFGWVPTAGFIGALLLALAFFIHDFPILSVYLGEAWTFGFLLVGAAFLAASERRWEVAAGAVALSLAVLTKQVGLFGGGAIALAWLVLLAVGGVRGRALVGRAAVLIGAGLVLPVLWELAKLFSFGPDGYLDLLRREIHEAGLPGGHESTDALATILGRLDDTYQGVLALVIVGAVSVVLALVVRRGAGTSVSRWRAGRGLTLWVMLWAGAVAQLGHFVWSRSDWPRYLWLAVVLAVAAAVAPIIALPSRVRAPLLAGLVAALAVLLVVRPLPADPFAEQQEHRERMAAIAWLDAHPDLPVMTTTWSQLFDLLFPRAAEGRWTTGDVRPFTGEPAVFVLNHTFLETEERQSALYTTAMRTCDVALEQETISLLTCGDAFWADLLAAPVGLGPEGGVLATLDTTTGLAPGPDIALSVVDDAPEGMDGPSVRESFTDVPTGEFRLSTRNLRADLSGYSDDARISVWIKASTIDHLGAVYLLLRSGDGWAAYGTTPTVAGEWVRAEGTKGRPGSSDSFDWADVIAVQLRADASDAPFTGDILWRDLRITEPDG